MSLHQCWNRMVRTDMHHRYWGSSSVSVHVASDEVDLARRSFQYLVRLGRQVLAVRRRFAICLAGGETPLPLYTLLALERDVLPWDRVHVFWGDERCVPPDHPASNWGRATRELLSRVSIPHGNIHPIRTEGMSADDAAAEYDRELRRFFGCSRDAWPRCHTFDVAILGVGSDGHTASIFPASPALCEFSKLALAVDPPKGSAQWPRITCTLATLNRSGHIMFLATGVDKSSVVRECLFPKANQLAHVASYVSGRNSTVWFVDADAVSATRGASPV